MSENAPPRTLARHLKCCLRRAREDDIAGLLDGSLGQSLGVEDLGWLAASLIPAPAKVRLVRVLRNGLPDRRRVARWFGVPARARACACGSRQRAIYPHGAAAGPQCLVCTPFAGPAYVAPAGIFSAGDVDYIQERARDAGAPSVEFLPVPHQLDRRHLLYPSILGLP